MKKILLLVILLFGLESSCLATTNYSSKEDFWLGFGVKDECYSYSIGYGFSKNLDIEMTVWKTRNNTNLSDYPYVNKIPYNEQDDLFKKMGLGVDMLWFPFGKKEEKCNFYVGGGFYTFEKYKKVTPVYPNELDDTNTYRISYSEKDFFLSTGFRYYFKEKYFWGMAYHPAKGCSVYLGIR